MRPAVLSHQPTSAVLRTLLFGLGLLALAVSPCRAADETVPAPEEVSREIDRIFEAAWQKQGVEPASPTDDASFLRRLSLDLTGIIPEVGEVRGFLADPRPDKRAKKVDELLARPRHATHLANQWREILLPRSIPESTSLAFQNWMQTRFREGIAYDQFVREILLTSGPLANAPQGLYFAALNSKPSELAASSSRVFLGVQIRCAECHDHPFTEWKQDDFWSYAAFFARVRGPSEMGGAADVTDASSGEVQNPTTKKTVPPRFLGVAAAKTETEPKTDKGSAKLEPRRKQIVDWMTANENPYFARAAANRVWSLLFGRGLVHPVDNLDENNPPSHPEVLNLLAADFARSRFDLQRMFRVLAGTKVYQLASSPHAEPERLAAYAVMPVRSLSAKQVYDCLVQATGRRQPAAAENGHVLEQRLEFLKQIEAPTREPTDFQGGIPQTLTMLNGPFVTELTSSWSSDLVAALEDSPFLSRDDRIDTLYLATLTRLPDSRQRSKITSWIDAHAQGKDTTQPLSDLLWGLVNSSEFVLNR